MKTLFAILAALALALVSAGPPREGDCEVCLKALTTIEERLGGNKKDLLKTEAEIDKFCDKPPTVRAGGGGANALGLD
jgi:hypothetical protein